MVRQQAISARIYYETLWRIEQEVMLGETTRNKILNDGARLWLDLADTRREMRMHEDQKVREKILQGFFCRWFPEAVTH